MADRVRVECINKTDRTSPHERISHIGGRNASGTRWKLTEGDAISGIEGGRWAFYARGGTSSLRRDARSAHCHA